jgi:hypothetical protein
MLMGNALSPGSPEELAEFANLQSRLPDLFRQVFADPLAPRCVVAVPGLSMDPELLSKIVGGPHYEERQLAMLMLLKLPNTRIVYVSSTPIDAAIIDYYLNLLPGIPAMHARRRLTMLSACDASPTSLTEKILDRPRLLERIRAAIGDPAIAHLSCFNVTELERTLAVRLGIPLYGCDPRLLYLGGKSGSRRCFREAGIEMPAGIEDLKSAEDVVRALAELKHRDPVLRRAVVKLNDGFSGECNAVFSFGGCPAGDPTSWVRKHLPLNLAFEACDMRWDHFIEKLGEMGGIVEEWIVGDGPCSPSVQLRITPVGELETISTHDQILGGPSGQVFQGCTFPANPEYATEINALSLRVGEVLRNVGALGRFGVDFVTVQRPEGWRHYAIEINLRKGGTTHTYQALQFLTNGRYDAEAAEFRTPMDQVRAYYATDNLVNPIYRRLTPADLVDIAVEHGLHFDQTTQKGVVFNLIGALSEFGKLAVVAIDENVTAAQAMFERTVETLDHEAASE